MIKKLQKRFLLLATGSLFLLLLMIVLSSSLLNYQALISDADSILQILADNSGQFPKNDKPKKAPAENGIPSRRFPDSSKMPPGRKELSLEVSYESRFFTAAVSAENGSIVLNTDHVAAIQDDEALSIAKKAQAFSSEQGFIGDYRFLKKAENQKLLIIFLDCGRKTDSFWRMTRIHAAISILSLAAVFCILRILSGKIVHPVAEAHKKQKQFISIAGHEIKTPLTIIDADSELLRLDIGEDNEWLEDICMQTKRLTNLTNELLQLSKLEEYNHKQAKIEFPISDIIVDTARSFQVLADKEHISLQIHAEPMLSYYGDENQIRRLAGILFDNAIKYTSGTGPIQAELKKRKQKIEFTIENPADHISREQCRYFFDRFYRTEQAQRSEKGGYGLGLAIAKSIVEAHHGEITAEIVCENHVRIKVVL